MLELGSGTGLAGLAASALGAARVVLSDLPYVMPQLAAAIAANTGTAKGVVEALPLDWCVSVCLCLCFSSVCAFVHACMHVRVCGCVPAWVSCLFLRV